MYNWSLNVLRCLFEMWLMKKLCKHVLTKLQQFEKPTNDIVLKSKVTQNELIINELAKLLMFK